MDKSQEQGISYIRDEDVLIVISFLSFCLVHQSKTA